MDDKELKVMKSKVIAAAGKCGTAKEILKDIFPEAFEDGGEWERIDNKVSVVAGYPNSGIPPCLNLEDSTDCPFAITMSPYDSAKSGKYKIEDGHLWRKRA